MAEANVKIAICHWCQPLQNILGRYIYVVAMQSTCNFLSKEIPDMHHTIHHILIHTNVVFKLSFKWKLRNLARI